MFVRIFTRAIAILTLIVTTSFTAVSTSFAANDECTGTWGAISVENVIVPANATCVLQGTKVAGNIIVNTGATLKATGIRVGGNVQSEGARLVQIAASSAVKGSVQLKQGGVARVSRTAIGGDLQFDANKGSIIAAYNRIGGNLQAFQNTGGLTISYNRINANLQCKENTPAPTGKRNVATIKEDQCASL